MKKILSIVLSLTLVVGLVSYVGIEPSYAAKKKATKKPAKVAGLTVTVASDTTAKLIWKKAKRAKKYQIFRKVTGEKSFKCIKTTKARTYTATQSPGYSYSYKVRGVSGKRKGKYSSVQSLTIPKKPVKTIKPSVYTLDFASNVEKQVTVVYSGMNYIDFTISSVAKVTSVVANNGIATYTVKPEANGTGTLRIYDRSDSSVAATIAIKVNFTDTGRDKILCDTTSLNFTSYTPQYVDISCLTSCVPKVDKNSTFTSIIDIDDDYDYWTDGGIRHIEYKLTPIKTGTTTLKIFDQTNPNTYITIPVTVNMPAIAADKDSLYFISKDSTQKISFNHTTVQNIGQSISNIAEITKISNQNGVVTYTIKAKNNGVGSIKVWNSNNTSVYAEIPITVNIRATLGMNLPIQSNFVKINNDCKLEIRNPDDNDDEDDYYDDYIDIDIGVEAIGNGKSEIYWDIYDEDGYCIRSMLLGRYTFNIGQKFRIKSGTVNLYDEEGRENYVIKLRIVDIGPY